ncbi:Uncharacterised protein [Chlamydia abortus]|nr:Uncharacterised protein [Chlamydia abortus]
METERSDGYGDIHILIWNPYQPVTHAMGGV